MEDIDIRRTKDLETSLNKRTSTRHAAVCSGETLNDMRFNTTMLKGLKPHYRLELTLYKEKLAKGHLQEAWRHLERTHILGQPFHTGRAMRNRRWVYGLALFA